MFSAQTHERYCSSHLTEANKCFCPKRSNFSLKLRKHIKMGKENKWDTGVQKLQLDLYPCDDFNGAEKFSVPSNWSWIGKQLITFIAVLKNIFSLWQKNWCFWCFHIFSPCRCVLTVVGSPGLVCICACLCMAACVSVSVHVFMRGLSCKRPLIRIGRLLVFWVFSAITQTDLLWDKLS